MTVSLRFLALGGGLALFAAACGPSAAGGSCVQDLDCAKGLSCEEGSCRIGHFVSCQSAAECPEGDFCPQGQCVADCTILGCASGGSCDSSSHLCISVVEAPPTVVVTGGGSGSAGNGGESGSASSGNGGSGSSAGTSTGAGTGAGTGAATCGEEGQGCCGAAPGICVSSLVCSDTGWCVIPTSNSSSSSSSSSSSGGGTTGGGSSSSSSSSSSGGTTGGVADAGPPPCTTETWSNFAEAFFANNCDSCHHHGTEFSTYSAVVSDSSSIQSEIESGNMPENATLSSSEENDILTWMNCGMPQ